MTKPFTILFVFSLLASFFQPIPPAAPHLVRLIYDDALAPGWHNWSWAAVNLSASSPVHSGSASISVTFDAWEGLYLHNASADTLGATYLRFYLHGGAAGGQRTNVFLNLDVGGNPLDGPSIAVPQPAANSWSEVQVPLSDLNPASAAVTSVTWQDSSGGSQPVFYIDDIAFVSPQHPDAPALSGSSLHPRSLPADGATTVTVRVAVSDPQGAADIASVSLDASALECGIVPLQDDGRSYDGGANDGLYGAVFTLPPGLPSGDQFLLLTALDQAGHAAYLPLGALNVLSAPGGSIPATLPQRFGWGSNAWSEAPGQDWQVESGVPWDYVYQYITYGWESWGPNFVQRFVQQAWDKDFIPMITVYMVLGIPPECGESAACYASKLQNASFVSDYLASLDRAAAQARGAMPVIFNLEPDFYGYMQQLSNSSSRPPDVQPDNPASYPVALNRPGYPNNLTGFGRYMVDLIHNTAPNTLIAPMASMWAAPPDPQVLADQGAIQNGQRVVAFIDAMGGAQSDLLVVEWSDRDAGSGLRPWWDDTDQYAPRPTRAILWENALSHSSGKRLLLWQVPVGNGSLDNTCDHYQDNRAAYAFNHTRDLFEAGVIGLLFGGGASCMTQVTTDGGFVAAQGAIAYSSPSAPTGLTLEAVLGPQALLRWNESPEPDLWQYRLLYRLNPSGSQMSLNVGRRNAYALLLPQAVQWQVRLVALDAMGNQSPISSPLLITTDQSAQLLFLPTVRH